MIDAAECVVIGSGALGSSVAFHLAKSGKQVALLDKHALGSQTSPRAAGLTSQARGTDLMTALAKRAVRKIEGFKAETGEDIVADRHPGKRPHDLKRPTDARLAQHVRLASDHVTTIERKFTGAGE